MTRFITIIAVIIGLCINLNAQLNIPSSVLASGATSLSGSNIKVNGTLGQTIIFQSSSNSIHNSQGFWNTVKKSFPTLIQDLSMGSQVFIYPNPSKDRVSINFDTDQEFNQFEIYDITGKIIRSYNLNSEASWNEDISDLSMGFYYFIFKGVNTYARAPILKIE